MSREWEAGVRIARETIHREHMHGRDFATCSFDACKRLRSLESSPPAPAPDLGAFPAWVEDAIRATFSSGTHAGGETDPPLLRSILRNVRSRWKKEAALARRREG